MEIFARDLLIGIDFLSVEDALKIAQDATNEHLELKAPFYEDLLCKMNVDEQDIFTMALAARGIYVVSDDVHADVQTEIPMKDVEVLSLDELQEKLLLEDEENGSVSPEFYSELTVYVDPVTLRRLNKWLSKVGINMQEIDKRYGPTNPKKRKKLVHDKYKKRLKNQLGRGLK